MPVDLPQSLAQGFREIAALPDELFEALLSGLRDLPLEIKQYRVFNDTGFAIRDLPDAGMSVKSAAFSLLLSKARSPSSIDQFVAELVETISPSFDKNLIETLTLRATAILNVRSLSVVAKAHDVLLEHANAFSVARIISDIRPVFGDDITAQPDAMVLVHMLSIAYHCAGDRRNFVVALDEQDLDHLIAVLQRAKAKQETLRETVRESKVPYVKVA